MALYLKRLYPSTPQGRCHAEGRKNMGRNWECGALGKQIQTEMPKEDGRDNREEQFDSPCILSYSALKNIAVCEL
jgi:hypothetical protein